MSQSDSADVFVDDVDDVAEAVDASPDAVSDALDDVAATLETLTAVDPDDVDAVTMEQIRQQLPTEPLAAELTAASLRGTPLGEAIEYVHPSDRQDGYWRRSRERSDPTQLTPAELRHRKAFIETAKETRGETGTTTTPDGRQISNGAATLQEQLSGTTFKRDGELTTTEQERGKSLLDRVRALFSR